MNLSETKSTLQKFKLAAKKSLGQNFLINDEILAKIVAAAELNSNDTVVEIGPGLGALTRELCSKVKCVQAVELDDQILLALKFVTRMCDNLIIFHESAFDFTPPGETYKLVANIPYYLTGKLFRRFFAESENKPSLIVLMIQREVAERIVEKTGKASLLSNLVKIYGEPEIVANVPRASFFPEPDVDSAVIRIRIFDQPKIQPEEIEGVMKIMGHCFRGKRKTILNSLGSLIGKESAEEILKKVGVDSSARAEKISLEKWEKIAKENGDG